MTAPVGTLPITPGSDASIATETVPEAGAVPGTVTSSWVRKLGSSSATDGSTPTSRPAAITVSATAVNVTVPVALVAGLRSVPRLSAH